MKSLTIALLAGVALISLPSMVNAKTVTLHYADHGAAAGSSSNAAGAGIVVHGFEVSKAGAENTSWATFGHTALTNSTSLGAGTAFGTGLGGYSFDGTGISGAYTNAGHVTLTIGGDQ